MKTLKQALVRNKKVLLRVDFNVPLKEGSNSKKIVGDDGRIKAVLPTIRYLMEKRAKIIILTHLGRPEGRESEEFSLDPVSLRLQELLGQIIIKCYSVADDDVYHAIDEMRPGEILMLKNLRFYPGEEANDKEFAKKLAKLGDVYINDAFGVSHRAHASIEAITHYLPSYAGLLLEKEINILNKLIKKPKRPFVVVMGGAKAKDKIPVIKHLKDKFDELLIGGVIGNSFIASRSVFNMGKSRFEPMDEFQNAMDHLGGKYLTKITGPRDCVVTDKLDGTGEIRIIGASVKQWDMPKGGMIVDIGPETADEYAKVITKAKMIFWNGNMGMSEVAAFAKGTQKIAEAVAKATAGRGVVSIAAGGDTTGFINQAGLADKFTYLSTGGGAALEFLAGLELPGIKSLSNNYI